MLQGRDPAARIAIRTLGETSVHAPPAERPAALGMKSLALLAFLADRAPRSASRDEIVDLLWERSGPAQGRGSLRQEIRRIKLGLGDEIFDAVFDVTDTHIGLVPGTFTLDLAEIEAAAASGRPEAIDGILALYGGDFLMDNAARAEAFQDWARARREAALDLVVSALVRLGRLALDGGDVALAQRAAERVIACDQTHEAGHELLIRCHLAEGRRGQARAHFEKFRQIMIRELATEPMPEIAALASRGAVAAPPPRPAPPPRAGDGRPTIAVLNVSERLPAEFAWLGQGVTEQIVANLSKSAWIRVAALNPSPFMPATIDADRSQRDLRDYADYVLRIAISAQQRRVRVVATLTSVAEQKTESSIEREDEIDDILDLQRSVARAVAAHFEPKMLEMEAKKEAAEDWAHHEDATHWRLLMRARWLFWTTRPANNQEARKLLDRALKISPQDIPTHCILAFSHMLDAWSDWSKDIGESVRQAQRWAARAVQIDPNDCWAQLTLGVACTTPELLDQAKARISHALRLSPSLAVAMGELGRVHAFLGETEAARRLSDEVLALSPYDQHSGLWVRTKAIADWIDGRLEPALELVDYSLVIRPAWFQNHFLRAAILAELGRVEAAKAAYEQGRKAMPRYSDASLRVGHPFRDEELSRRFVAALAKAGRR